MQDDSTDYLAFYDPEAYLLRAGRRFRETGDLDVRDFYMILIWKANRAKIYHKSRLTKIAGSFDGAVKRIASELLNAREPRIRLALLMENWKFALPTATAILTILYPEEFTVYDYRVCAELNRTYRPWVEFSDKLWEEYCQFKRSVLDSTPAGLSLRDKDRWLMGRSFRMQVESECSNRL